MLGTNERASRTSHPFTVDTGSQLYRIIPRRSMIGTTLPTADFRSIQSSNKWMMSRNPYLPLL